MEQMDTSIGLRKLHSEQIQLVEFDEVAGLEVGEAIVSQEENREKGRAVTL